MSQSLLNPFSVDVDFDLILKEMPSGCNRRSSSGPMKADFGRSKNKLQV